MDTKISQLVQEVVSSPLGDIIASVGEGVAQAQQALDEGSLEKTLEIYSEGGDEALQVLRDIGYRPTFYVLPETTAEVNIALSLGNTTQPPKVNTQRSVVGVQLSRAGINTPLVKPKLYGTPLNGGYVNRYGFGASIAAKLTFKIVPIPAPEGVDELRVLPNFVGRTVTQALLIAEQLDLELSFTDQEGGEVSALDSAAVISAQSPEMSSDGTPQVIRVDNDITLVVTTG
ncbi:MAG: hypothetical protein COB04_05135 [Gammaproteobacteria bacterium]|nr:MAG: hypothetical protein COB04_05135 [Gammaproteobacteria bacterium]